MQKPDEKSQDLQELKGKETIELAVPPSTDATQLLRFMARLDERFHSDYHSATIMHIVGSLYRGTLITISLGDSSLAEFLDKISGMPDVEKVEEEPLTSGAFPRFPTKFASLRRSSISPSYRLRLTLKETSIARQELATV